MDTTLHTQLRMKTINVADATEIQLDWLVAKIKGVTFDHIEHSKCKTKTWLWLERDMDDRFVLYTPSTDWSQGGPLFSAACITSNIVPHAANEAVEWCSCKYRDPEHCRQGRSWYGATELIAKARCYVGSELGDTAEVPEVIA